MVRIGEKYRHYKNNKDYVVIALGKDKETLTDMVVYQGQYDDPEFGKNPVWIREKSNFEAIVDIDGHATPRFVLIV